MFVSIVLDPGNIDSSHDLVRILMGFGFKKVQRAVWESSSVRQSDISCIKREIDRVTDYYDKVRLYQYPVDEAMELTILDKKKWKCCILKPQMFVNKQNT